jgi:hypothetical protein
MSISPHSKPQALHCGVTVGRRQADEAGRLVWDGLMSARWMVE